MPDKAHEQGKILYFEGAGLSSADISRATIGNCRIRTAFHLDDGRAVYLEITGNERSKHCNPAVYRWRYTGFVVAVHYITDDDPNDDFNKHRIVLPWEKKCGGWVQARTFEYTEEAILKYVKNLGASFDAVKVVPDLGGYQVFQESHPFDGPDVYNYGDEFQFDPVMTARRETIYKWVYDLELREMEEDRTASEKRFCHSPSGRDFPNFSLWIDEKDPGLLHLLRHFTGRNNHWSIRTDAGVTLDDCLTTMQETVLGVCGC